MSINEKEYTARRITSTPNEDYNESQSCEPISTHNDTKTPVSLLQELCVRRRQTPKYEIVQQEGAAHEPTFKYRVTVGEAVATGSGSSKIKAKHDAAKNLYMQLETQNNTTKITDNNYLSTTKEKNIHVERSSFCCQSNCSSVVNRSILNQSNISDEKNPISELQDLMQRQKMASLKYVDVCEEGAAHSRIFYVICIVEARYCEAGFGTTKKAAKKQAATKILNILSPPRTINNNEIQIMAKPTVDDSFAPPLRRPYRNHEKSQAYEKSLLTYEWINKANNSNTTEWSMSDLLRKFILSNDSREKIMSLQDENIDLSSIEDPETYLKEIAEQQKFKLTFSDIDNPTNSNHCQCLVQLIIAKSAVAVIFGTSHVSLELARINAARNSLKFIRLITK